VDAERRHNLHPFLDIGGNPANLNRGKTLMQILGIDPGDEKGNIKGPG